MNQQTAYNGPGKRIRTNPELFLSKTEVACRHFFGGLELYEQKVDGAAEDVLTLDPLSREFKGRMQALKTFLTSDFARALLAGSILQIAYMGIEMFSRNKSIPRQCDWIVKHDNKTNKKAVAFSVGRPVPDQQIVECYSFGPRAQQIPLGLVVYAGRNQYCHWYDIEQRFERSRQKPRNASVAAVFSALATPRRWRFRHAQSRQDPHR